MAEVARAAGRRVSGSVVGVAAAMERSDSPLTTVSEADSLGVQGVPEPAEHVVSNVPPLPATTGYGEWGDEPTPMLLDSLAMWRHLGGRLRPPRYAYQDAMRMGQTSLEVIVPPLTWAPEVGWLVAVSQDPLCKFVWRVKSMEANRDGGVNYMLTTTSGKPHNLDTDRVWRNGRWAPVWRGDPKTNSGQEPEANTDVTIRVPPAHLCPGPAFHAGITRGWPGQQVGTYKESNVCIGNVRLTTAIVLLEQDRPAVGSLMYLAHLRAETGDNNDADDDDDSGSGAQAVSGAGGAGAGSPGLGPLHGGRRADVAPPGRLDDERYHWLVIGHIEGYATGVLLMTASRKAHNLTAWDLDEKNRVTAERLAALKRQGKRRGGRRTKTYEEPERDWRVIGYARRPPQPPLPDMPQRPPPPPVVPYSAQRLLVPGPPDKPKARSSAAAAAAEKIARDLRQTVFVPGLADALLIASSAAGDDGVEILQRAAKYGIDDEDGRGGGGAFALMLGAGKDRNKPPKMKAGTAVGEQRLKERLAATVDDDGKWIHPYNRAPRPHRKPKPWEVHVAKRPPRLPRLGPALAEDESTDLIKFPPRPKFALIIRLLHVKDAFAAEGSDVPFRYVTRRVTEHADVVDMVFWDGSTTEHSSKCALHLYNFPDDFDPRYYLRKDTSLKQWVDYRESFCVASLPVPALHFLHKFDDDGRSAALLHAFKDFAQLLADMYRPYHVVLRVVRTPTRTARLLGVPQKGFFTGTMTMRDTLELVEAAATTLCGGTLSVLDVSSLPGSADIGFVRLMSRCVAYLLVSDLPSDGAAYHLDHPAASNSVGTPVRGKKLQVPWYDQDQDGTDAMLDPTVWDAGLCASFFPPPRAGASVATSLAALKPCLERMMQRSRRRWKRSQQSMLRRFVWRSVALIDCANVRSLIYALARSHREQLLMYGPRKQFVDLEAAGNDLLLAIDTWPWVPERSTGRNTSPRPNADSTTGSSAPLLGSNRAIHWAAVKCYMSNEDFFADAAGRDGDTPVTTDMVAARKVGYSRLAEAVQAAVDNAEWSLDPKAALKAAWSSLWFAPESASVAGTPRSRPGSRGGTPTSGHRSARRKSSKMSVVRRGSATSVTSVGSGGTAATAASGAGAVRGQPLNLHNGLTCRYIEDVIMASEDKFEVVYLARVDAMVQAEQRQRADAREALVQKMLAALS